MEEEKLYLAADDECYIEMHLNADGDWDYTLYDYDLNEIDGGVVSYEEDIQTQHDALLIICIMHRLAESPGPIMDMLYELDHETFDTIKELMNK